MCRRSRDRMVVGFATKVSERTEMPFKVVLVCLKFYKN